MSTKITTTERGPTIGSLTVALSVVEHNLKVAFAKMAEVDLDDKETLRQLTQYLILLQSSAELLEDLRSQVINSSD